MTILLVAALVLIPLTACTFTPRDTGTAFMFALQPVEIAGQGAEKDNLIVFMPTTSPELDTHRIALNRGGKQWDYYAGARWADFLPLLVQDNITKTLEQAHLFKTVATGDSGLTGDKILKTEIRAFQAEYKGGSAAPVVKIRMIVRLVSRLERRPLASFVLEAEKKTSGDSLSAIQSAFAAAFNETQRQLVGKLGAAAL
jgi:cholesterol transport system auxiliary component